MSLEKAVAAVFTFVIGMIVLAAFLPHQLAAEQEFGDALAQQDTGDPAANALLRLFAWLLTSPVGLVMTVVGMLAAVLGAAKAAYH